VTNNLDVHVGAYGSDFPYALDNDLILNWYPQRVVALAPGRSLLELGIGHGHSARRFATRFPRYVVVEGSQAIIDRFRSQHGTGSIDVAHAMFEDFDTDETFDVIVMGFVLEHVADPDLVLRRFRRFLAPGGSLFVAVPNAESLHRRLGHEAGLLGDLMELGDGDRQLGHLRLYTVASLRRAIEQAGYVVTTVEGLLLKPITTAQIESLRLPDAVLHAMLKVGVSYPELSVGILMQAGLGPA
jgi:2-polyprenyl-3-methyl-5-hydroxy-6-metoxy-1,4-benzoquinol methylase